MARRKASAREIVDLVASMPWWVGIAGAVLAWAICQLLMVHFSGAARAAAMQASAPGPGQVKAISSTVIPSMLAGLASVGRIVLPVLFVIGAAISAVRRQTGTRLLRAASGSDAAQAVSNMTWQEFEQLVGAHFSARGFSVQRTGGAGADGGIDLRLRRGAELFLVQCKQWRAFTVGVGVVRELYGVMAAEGAAGGYVVTSGRFTAEAREFAHGRNITLLDGAQLRTVIHTAAPVAASAAPRATDARATPPKCPACGNAMVRRTARKGVNAGGTFWGCVTYPRCKGTLPG